MNHFNRCLLLGVLIPFGAACSSAGTTEAAVPATQAPLRSSVSGQFAHYLVSPRGDVDGALLADGTVLRFGPQTLSATAGALRPGDTVQVNGTLLQTGVGRTLTEASLSAGNVEIVSPSTAHPPPPPARPELLESVSATGPIQAFLSDPRGQVDGFVLQDGTSVHAGPASKIDTLGLKIGDVVTVQGRGGSYAQGRALDVELLTLPSGEQRTLRRARPVLAPVTRDGVVDIVLLNPHGDVDGLLLRDGSVVQFHPTPTGPHLTSGIRIKAMGNGAGSFLEADTLALPGNSDLLALSPPSAPPAPPAALGTVEDASVIAHVISGASGEPDALILRTGTIVRIPPGLRDDALGRLTAGTSIKVRGEGGTYGKVKALRAETIELASGQVLAEPRPLAPPPPPPVAP